MHTEIQIRRPANLEQICLRTEGFYFYDQDVLQRNWPKCIESSFNHIKVRRYWRLCIILDTAAWRGRIGRFRRFFVYVS